MEKNRSNFQTTTNARTTNKKNVNNNTIKYKNAGKKSVSSVSTLKNASRSTNQKNSNKNSSSLKNNSKQNKSTFNASTNQKNVSSTSSVKVKKVNPKLKRTINKISIVTMFILAIVSFYLIFRILVLNMIPLKYFILILLVLFVILGIMSLLLINRKIKWKIKVGCIVFSILMTVVMLFASHYIESTISFINKITKNNTETEVYYLVTLKESKYESINDVDSQIGYVPSLGNINEAVDEIKKSKDFKYKEYKQIPDLKEDLLKKKINAILVADYYLEENEEFKDKIKIIHTINIKKEQTNKSKKVNVTKEPFNIYISGIDTYGDIGTVSRSDVNIIVSVNPNTKQILLTTIPRDFYVTLHGYGAKDKLTHAGVFGIDTSVGTLEDFLDIDINYYVRVNFSTLEDIVDALGGVDVYSETTFKYTYGSLVFKRGYNHVDGKTALIFARERKAFADGDRQRGKNQQAVIKAIINKAISPAIISNYSNLLKSLQGTFQTNMSSSEIQKLAKFQIDKMPSWDILNISVNGSDSSNTTYLYGNTVLYVMEPYKESVDYAKEKIKELISGQTIEVKKEKASDVFFSGMPDYMREKYEKKNEEKEEDKKTEIEDKPSTDTSEKPSDNLDNNDKPNDDESSSSEEEPVNQKPDEEPINQKPDEELGNDDTDNSSDVGNNADEENTIPSVEESY